MPACPNRGGGGPTGHDDSVAWHATRTHVSWLLFTDEHVYKGKRAVRLDFVDLSTSAARRRACRREVELNRRLSPDVYEGLGRFSRPGGISEAVVVMKRMPGGRRLSHLVEVRAADVTTALGQVAAVMADFHRRAARGPGIERHCRAPALRRLWHESLDTLARFPTLADPEVLVRIDRLSSEYLSGRGPLLASRIAAGRAVDGHGDLLADDIFCLADGPRILDCLEFDDRLRHLDPLADLASLAMDLERLGRPDLGAHLLAAYSAAAGDTWPASLVDHWVAYRAVVRAKVAAIRHSESEADADADECRRLLDLAADHLRRGEVRLVLVGGPPGAGKSTVAAGLAEARGWTLLRSDLVRRETGGPPSYDREARDRVYGQMLSQAGRALGQGTSVVLDATWSRAAWRRRARGVGQRASAPVVELCCRAPEDVRSERAASRAREGRDVSDADAPVALALAAELQPWPEATVIDTGHTPDAAVRAALSASGA